MRFDASRAQLGTADGHGDLPVHRHRGLDLALLTRLGEVYVTLIERHAEILRSAIAGNGGTEVRHRG